MLIALGVLVGLAVGATGIGSGTLALPILVLTCHIPPAEAVGTSLLFGSAIKLSAAACYVLRRQVAGGVLLRMLAGGLPGALVGCFVLRDAQRAMSAGAILTVLGATVVIVAAVSLLRGTFKKAIRPPRLWLLPWLSVPIGAAVGFSSSGGGVLGTLALMRLTALEPAVVVGTDIVFGIALSLASGGFDVISGTWNAGILIRFAAGGAAGSIVGAWLAGRAPAGRLRVIVLVAALALGAAVLYTGVSAR